MVQRLQLPVQSCLLRILQPTGGEMVVTEMVKMPVTIGEWRSKEEKFFVMEHLPTEALLSSSWLWAN